MRDLSQARGLLRDAAWVGAFESAYLRSAEAWPQFVVPPEAYAQALVGSFDQGGALTFAAHLDSLATVDVYVAVACRVGDRHAIAHVSDELLPSICDSLTRVAAIPFGAEDACQRLRERFLMPQADGSPPAISTYQGRGRLMHWLRASALRELLADKRREERRSQVEANALADVAPAVDVELDLLRRLHSSDFRQAFENAFLALSARERTLLRMHVVEGLNIDQIGAFYHTHKTTAFRWLESARQALAAGIRKRLATELRLSDASLDSLMGWGASEELKLSLNRLLLTTQTPGSE